MTSQLVDIQSVVPTILVELKYATKNNFTGQVVYDFERCFVLKEVALKLCNVQAELEKMELGLKIWDGFRPMAAQRKFWEICPDPKYVADPREGGRHTRGTSVDLTLVTKDGHELLMPSPFDEFSERSHQNYQKAGKEATQNRTLLKNFMEKHGFVSLASEWWHFDLMGWQNYPVIESSALDFLYR